MSSCRCREEILKIFLLCNCHHNNALTTFHPPIPYHLSGEEALKVERLKSKMTTNLDMARERVTDLCMLTRGVANLVLS